MSLPLATETFEIRTSANAQGRAERAAIAVGPADRVARHQALLRALESLYPVSFVAGNGGEQRDVEAKIIFTESPAEVLAAEQRSPCLVIHDTAESTGVAVTRTIRFSDEEAVPSPFRGRLLVEQGSPDVPGLMLAPGPGDVILATQDGTPVWMRHRGGHASGSLESVSIPLPRIAKGELLIQYLNRDRFVGLLPLMVFVRRVSARHDWIAPPLRACFVFDDPNLRRRSYGCLDFRKLAIHARERKYHAAIATIPIDAPKTASDVAAIFRDHPAQLSLAIHGNNHLNLELAMHRTNYEPTAALAQASHRMHAMARRHRLEICSVLEPPYGAIRSEFLSVLGILGYEAALVTIRQFDQWNRDGNHAPAFGLASAESLADGLAMIPRITAAPGWESEAAVAAFLGQPIVIAGHHFDASEGFEFMSRVADVVNGMGRVTWSNLSGIARSQYATKRDGATLRVRAASRRIVMPVPDDVDSIVVERPWIAAGRNEPLRWGAPAASPTVASPMPARSVSIPVAGGGRLEIVSPAPAQLDPASVPPPPTKWWPFARRAFTEVRDRCYPYLPRSLRS